jgi:hypothetical protein
MANLIRLKQIESGSALNTAAQVGTDFSASVISVVIGEVSAVLPDGVISSSAQLDGTTLRNITIAPINSDGYSLIVSGALGVVDATNLSDGGFGDNDSTVPAQIWLNGETAPTDPSSNNQPLSNQIDMGEW